MYPDWLGSRGSTGGYCQTEKEEGCPTAKKKKKGRCESTNGTIAATTRGQEGAECLKHEQRRETLSRSKRGFKVYKGTKNWLEHGGRITNSVKKNRKFLRDGKKTRTRKSNQSANAQTIFMSVVRSDKLKRRRRLSGKDGEPHSRHQREEKDYTSGDFVTVEGRTSGRGTQWEKEMPTSGQKPAAFS